jgi:hypothetical protein
VSGRFHSPIESARFVLITECLQNDFSLNTVSPVALPEATRRAILLGRRNFDLSFHHGDQLRVAAKHLEQGPLGIFLGSTIGRRRTGEDGAATLDVINIRQWRSRDQAYDEEGRPQVYCEAGTWGAGYIDGLQQYLDPGGTPATEEARYFEEGSVRIHHVHADSPFAFRPRREQINIDERKLQASALEILLDVIVQGADEDVARMRELLRQDGRPSSVVELAREINSDESIRFSNRVYVAVIGAHTDAHVCTLLFGLRDRYAIPYLAVSDTLTAAPSVERHISGLNFAADILDVDVIHGVNDLARFLGSTPPLEDEWEVVTSKPFSAYVAFDARTRRVTAQQEETLQAYLALTEGRSARVYRQIERANIFLIGWGSAFLSLTLLFLALHPFFPDRIPWQLPLITGGISLVQFASAFFGNPTDSLQQNLINLAALRMILESHSLKSVFARLHLAPARMVPADTAADAESARREAELTVIRTEALAGQLRLLNEIDTVDFDALKRFGRLQHESPEAAASEPPTTDGNASTPE